MEVVDAHMHLWTSETHPWLLKVKDGGHPAGSFGRSQVASTALEPCRAVILHCLGEGRGTFCIRANRLLFFFSAPVIPYMLEDYRKDTADYNVTHCVHVEAAWPGDPVGETRSENVGVAACWLPS